MNLSPLDKVMLVEDDPTMRSLLKTLLEIEGFQITVHPGTTADQIVSAVQTGNPDVLLMDVNLRGFSGLDVLKRIRENPVNTGLRILMTSGMDVKDQCLDLGANGFLMKPYMPDDLINWIRKDDDRG
jgi:two-component system nitrate/nitrite response regulator NarP